jgi:hypothetical protein
MRASPIAAVVFLAVLFVVGCTQGPSLNVSSAGVTAPTSAQIGPGASYNATGSWRLIVWDKPNGTIQDDNDESFVQDADGNLHTADGTGTLTRLGTGQTIAYSVSIIEPHPTHPCSTTLSGQAQIHTKDDTFYAHLSGIEAELDCSYVEFWVTGTKNP